MRQNVDARTLAKTILARAAHAMVLCCIPIFSLVLVLNETLHAYSNQRTAHLPEPK